ncbi:hypothetical protein NC652_028862 [Populus alba x Populus x berolinensis]|nr:hypothetical protein NC652_028862 [Populus alba x Populus x berolinensis]
MDKGEEACLALVVRANRNGVVAREERGEQFGEENWFIKLDGLSATVIRWRLTEIWESLVVRESCGRKKKRSKKKEEAYKLNLTTGLVPNLNVSAALLAFVFLRTWTKLLSKAGIVTAPFTRQENTIVQTCVVYILNKFC